MTEKIKKPKPQPGMSNGLGHKAKLREIELEKAEIELARERLRLLDDRRAESWALAKGIYNGEFRLDGFIREDLIAQLTSNILQWKRVQAGATPPVVLYITSPGGDAYAAFALYDTLRTLSAQGHTVTTVIRGFAASGAGVISQAGDVRLIGAESFIHIHEAGAGIMGKAAEVKDEAMALEQMSRRMAGVYAARSTLTAEEIYNRFERREWWVSSTDALELGFADSIG
jgi:ATP-dependent protease ClpP protease subunit